MEGLFACHPGRRCSQVSDLRRRLGPGSLPGGQLAWATVDVELGQKQISLDAAPPMPPPSKNAALGMEPLLLPSCDGTWPGQLAPGASAGGFEKKEKSFTYLWDASCSKKKESEVSLLKFKGIPVTDSLVLEESRTNLTNTTATFHFEKDTGENGSAVLLNVKGIPSPDPNANANMDEPAMRNIINVEKSLTQLFVKVCEKEVSMQEDFNTTTIKELMDAACYRAGIKTCDFYAVYGGKRLKADKPIAYYPIFKDSTIHLRSRFRAGRDYTYVAETFDNLMRKNKDNKFRQVTLSSLSENKKTKAQSVTFLSQFSAYYIHKIMVYICGKHREGVSFDGKFSVSDILIINKMMVEFDTSNLQNYEFSEDTCSNDYAKLLEIFTTYFTESGKVTAVYFAHFLQYLFDCPAKEKSNSEPVIQFITNHPALTCYMDRIKQCLLLDSMARRLDINDQVDLGNACVQFPTWRSVVEDVPALEKVYLYNSKFDPIKNKTIVNAEYDSHILGCLHFARNYFSHADFQLKLLEVEAAFAATIEDFLPTILLNVAMDFKAPADFDIITLLGNPLADSFE